MNKLVSALVIAFCFPTVTSAASRKIEEVLVIAANAADLIATEIWLHKDPYVHEGRLRIPGEVNPLARGPFAKRAAMKAGTTAATLLIARLWERRGHAKAASALRWSATVLYFGAAGWNASLSIRF